VIAGSFPLPPEPATQFPLDGSGSQYPRARGTYAFHYLRMRVPVTYIDRKLAQLAASYSYEPFEKCLQFLTAIGDEKILGSTSLVAW
jgi:hypothetical protein